MPERDDAGLASALAENAAPLSGGASDLDPLLDLVGDAACVLVGEATHGTHEFYRLRAQLTKRLIAERGFCAVAAEADWPDAFRVNRYVRGRGPDSDGVEALSDFRRFPAWMWRNADVLDFVGWLREHNRSLAEQERVGFYGLDLYSLHSSIEQVLAYLDRVDPEAAARARRRYGCFEQFREDPQAYGHAASFALDASCEGEVVAQLLDLRRQREARPRGEGLAEAEERFQAEQNARVVKDAEEYYRAMLGDHVASWNLRDTHMADTLDALLEHLGEGGGEAKVVVWAHNSHVGDARATEAAEEGELNIGQLARQRHPGQVRLVGATTYAGTVTAAASWGGPAERMDVRPGLAEGYEALFHRVGLPGFCLDLTRLGEAAGALKEPRLERAIGVVYQPRSERRSHYFRARLAEQFDALLHVDHTRAVEPLEKTAGWERGETPETFPSGF